MPLLIDCVTCSCPGETDEEGNDESGKPAGRTKAAAEPSAVMAAAVAAVRALLAAKESDSDFARAVALLKARIPTETFGNFDKFKI